jgi:hypothetical protein
MSRHAITRVYASTVHCRPLTDACSARWIDGKATLTVVTSMPAMNTPRPHVASTTEAPRVTRELILGRADDRIRDPGLLHRASALPRMRSPTKPHLLRCRDAASRTTGRRSRLARIASTTPASAPRPSSTRPVLIGARMLQAREQQPRRRRRATAPGQKQRRSPARPNPRRATSAIRWLSI